MQNKNFKVGEWIFCEFKLQQIKKMNEGRITSVTDGMFEHGSHDLSDRAFKLDLKVKQASDSAEYWSREFHKLKNNGLNHPRLHAKIVEKWVAICENLGDESLSETLYKDLHTFGKNVVDKVAELSNNQIEGVSLFRN